MDTADKSLKMMIKAITLKYNSVIFVYLQW